VLCSGTGSGGCCDWLFVVCDVSWCLGPVVVSLPLGSGRGGHGCCCGLRFCVTWQLEGQWEHGGGMQIMYHVGLPCCL
jgi:hypothetical protein